MTDDELERLVEADVARVAALARVSIRHWYEWAEAHPDHEARNLRFDTFMVLGVPVWNGDYPDDAPQDGEFEREDVFVACESRKYHVKLGLLLSALKRQSG